MSAGVCGVVNVQDLMARRMRAEQRAHLVREVVETILLTALIFLVVHFAVGTFLVDGPSMQPGLVSDERLLVNQVAYIIGGPQRGDVIIFHHHHIPADPFSLRKGCTVDPGTNSQYMSCDFVKRVIATPGDTVQITATQVIVDSVVLREPYVSVPPGEAENDVVLAPTKLGANQYYVMGDNRLNSSDSRSFGPIARQDIIGRVVMVFYPFNSVHLLPNYSYVFANVKQ
jgi:signal peptidase I